MVCPLFLTKIRVKKDSFFLFALVSILSQSFFTLVGRHFMSFFLLSAWHSTKIKWLVNIYFVILFCIDCECLGRLERRDVVFRNNQSCVL